jgi:hypothetical protein
VWLDLDDAGPVVLTGVIMAAICSAWVTLIRVFQGQDFFTELGVSFGKLVLIYFGGGIVAGAIVALLLPIGRWLVGATMIGYLAALPFFSLLSLTTLSPDEWHRIGLFVTLASSLVGAGAGAVAWNDFSGRKDARRREIRDDSGR